MATSGAKKGSSLGFYLVCMMDDRGLRVSPFYFRSSTSNFKTNLFKKLSQNWSLDCVLNARWYVFDARTKELIQVHEGALISSETGELI